jgi:hypothetical protein
MNHDSKAAAIVLEAMLNGETWQAREELAALGYTPEEQGRWLGRPRRELEDMARPPVVRTYAPPDRTPIELPGDIEEAAFQAVLAAAMPRHRGTLEFWRWSSRPKENGTRRAVLFRYALELLHPGPGPADMTPAECEARQAGLPDVTRADLAAHYAKQAAQEARYREWEASEEGKAAEARWYEEHGMAPPEPPQAPQSPAIEAGQLIDTRTGQEHPGPAKAAQAPQDRVEEEAASYAAAEAEIAALAPRGFIPAPFNPDPLGDMIAAGALITACYPFPTKDGGIAYSPYRPNAVWLHGAKHHTGDYDARRGFWNDRRILEDIVAGKGDPDGRGRCKPCPVLKFEPGQAGFVCLDLDRNHANGADGLAGLLASVRRAFTIVPSYFQDIEGGSFPCYVKTPSGGVHLYFRYTGGQRLGTKYQALPGVDFFHLGSMPFAPGSVKVGKPPYELYGSLKMAPMVPRKLLEAIGIGEVKAKVNIPFVDDARQVEQGEHGRVPLAWIKGDIEKKGRSKGRNDFAFTFANYAKVCGYAEGEVLAYLAGTCETEAELSATVHSAFRGKRK